MELVLVSPAVLAPDVTTVAEVDLNGTRPD